MNAGSRSRSPGGCRAGSACRPACSGSPILFVMLAEVLIYVPSVANFRHNWLNDRLAAAQVAALVLDAAPDERLSEDLEAQSARRGRGRGDRRTRRRPPAAACDGRRCRRRSQRPSTCATASWTTLIADAFESSSSPAQRSRSGWSAPAWASISSRWSWTSGRCGRRCSNSPATSCSSRSSSPASPRASSTWRCNG